MDPILAPHVAAGILQGLEGLGLIQPLLHAALPPVLELLAEPQPNAVLAPEPPFTTTSANARVSRAEWVPGEGTGVTFVHEVKADNRGNL